jgi:hypothetical protein
MESFPEARQLARTGKELSREARVRLRWMDFYRRSRNLVSCTLIIHRQHALPFGLILCWKQASASGSSCIGKDWKRLEKTGKD